jgi:hypothetical protein
LLNKYHISFLIALTLFSITTKSQCLMSVNPVGGTENLLTLEKNSLRLITFYKYGQGTQYLEGSKKSDYNFIDKSFYHYVSANAGYGITNRLTLETEIGYFLNKTQIFNTIPQNKLSGSGFSSIIPSLKYNFYTNHVLRLYYSASAGIKIPGSREPKQENNVELPIDLQPTLGAFGAVFNSILVKENSERGMRFFVTNRLDINGTNTNNYQQGISLINAFYISKHLMAPYIKGDWTAILQVRNEIRNHDLINKQEKESSGSVLFFVVPQINYVLKEKTYLSLMTDIPVYQSFNGTQMGAGPSITVSVSRAFGL